MHQSKIAITGATGLVGSHLLAELISRGFRDFTLPVRSASRVRRMTATLDREGVDHSNARFNVLEIELTNPVELKDAFTGIDTVFNCAAAVSLGAMDEQKLIDGNVQIARHVVNACLDAGVGKLVHVSSIAALGEAPEGAEYIDETMVPESLSGMPAYYAGKLLSENEVMRGVACGLRAVVVNPAVILGAGDWHSGSTAMVPYMTMGIPFYTEGVTGMVDVKDVARAMADLAEYEDAVGQRYILCGANISYKEFLTLSARSSGAKPPRIRTGRSMLGTAWRGAWLWSKLTGSQPLFNKDLTQVLLKKTRYSTEKIKNTLNFEFTPIGETIDRIVKQYLAEEE